MVSAYWGAQPFTFGAGVSWGDCLLSGYSLAGLCQRLAEWALLSLTGVGDVLAWVRTFSGFNYFLSIISLFITSSGSIYALVIPSW